MLCDIVSDCLLVQLITANTCQDNLLDLVLTNNPDNIFSVTVCDNILGTAVKFPIEVLKLNICMIIYNKIGTFGQMLLPPLLVVSYFGSRCCRLQYKHQPKRVLS